MTDKPLYLIASALFFIASFYAMNTADDYTYTWPKALCTACFYIFLGFGLGFLATGITK